MNDKLRKERSNPEMLSAPTPSDAVSEDLLAEQLADIYRERTKLRDVYNAYRRGLRDEARIEELHSYITEAVSTLPSFPEVHYTSATHREGIEAVLLLSDFHIGVNCNNFYNTYNTDVAGRRLAKLVDRVCRYCSLYHVSQLNVLNLGDLIHGIIHVNARIEQMSDVISQVMIAAELLANTLYEIQKFVPVVYRSCVDNHARIIADKNQHVEKENLNKLID